jgi:uncharacterized FlaG/YvyC family protein
MEMETRVPKSAVFGGAVENRASAEKVSPPPGRKSDEAEKPGPLLPQKEENTPGSGVAVQAAKVLERLLSAFDRALKVELRKEAGVGAVKVTVYNPNTNEVIREIPPEETIRLVEHVKRKLDESLAPSEDGLDMKV